MPTIDMPTIDMPPSSTPLLGRPRKDYKDVNCCCAVFYIITFVLASTGALLPAHQEADCAEGVCVSEPVDHHLHQVNVHPNNETLANFTSIRCADIRGDCRYSIEEPWRVSEGHCGDMLTTHAKGCLISAAVFFGLAILVQLAARIDFHNCPIPGCD